ncbi:MAG: manganese efflux pump MntP family protein, partial [Acetanaerobacterium sp.]
MSVLTLLILSVALAMDAFAVSVSNGMCMTKRGIAHTLPFALAFGVAQGVMPVIGWLAGQTFASSIRAIDHWIALIVL